MVRLIVGWFLIVGGGLALIGILMPGGVSTAADLFLVLLLIVIGAWLAVAGHNARKHERQR
jgi:hypothetical protein